MTQSQASAFALGCLITTIALGDGVEAAKESEKWLCGKHYDQVTRAIVQLRDKMRDSLEEKK
jgi:hypothetical protein